VPTKSPRRDIKKEKRTIVYLVSLVIFLALWALLLILPGPSLAPADSTGAGAFLPEDQDWEARDQDEPDPTSSNRSPKLALVIDDVGYSLDELQPFLELPYPITFAVLPFLEHSQESVNLIRENGHQAILHMPMEPLGDRDPGPGAVFLEDTENQVREKIQEAIEDLPGIVGVNNHMGSAVTSDFNKMRVILEEVTSRGLFFLDSLTTAGSKVKEAGQSLSIDT
jgi:polysaccharide deacetylase 2 family uncharacterized protein YibQ